MLYNETTVEGTIEKIIFYNSKNGYIVFALNDDSETTCCGYVLNLEEGMYVRVTGDIVIHKKYGPQVQIKKLVQAEPQDTQSIEKYLASGVVKGIGAKLAKKIVEKFGEDTFAVIEDEPERLSEIRGITEKKARDIYAQVIGDRSKRDVMMFLEEYDIKGAVAIKLYNRYKDSLKKILKENPYIIIEDIEGIGFKKADEIAKRIGFSFDSEIRVNHCIVDVLKSAAYNGHVFLPKDILYDQIIRILGFRLENFDDILSNLVMDKKIIIREICTSDDEMTYAVYYAPYYYVEKDCARLLFELNTINDITSEYIEASKKELLENCETMLNEMQIESVLEAIKNNIFILTGGPGTGKTTTIKTIINFFEKENLQILLCAPTGRAAKRMQEATGRSAKTIHRLLEVQPSEGDNKIGGGYFNKNEDNPIEADVIIVDEMSMVDINLFHSLLLAIVPGTHIIFVGDTSQLPSVGSGRVLKDMIDSQIFKSKRLTKIYRQADNSDIIVNAHLIDNGREIDSDSFNKNDFYFVKTKNHDRIISGIKKYIGEIIPSKVKINPFDVQVLSPTKVGDLGTKNLNTILQDYLNPQNNSKLKYEYGNKVFRQGDKVMQIKNDYQLEWRIYDENDRLIEDGTGIFNGDIGTIIDIDFEFEYILIKFDDEKVVSYPFEALDELDLSYAITIHKSQGSEYPIVIIPLCDVPPLLRSRNLLYTAITRARDFVIILGDEEVFKEMIHNEKERKRYTTLRYHLLENSKIM